VGYISTILTPLAASCLWDKTPEGHSLFHVPDG
jgi:hypothetical protein